MQLRIGFTAMAACAAAALNAGQAVAAPSVGIHAADASGGSAAVTGTATFPPITAPQSVVGSGAAITAGPVGGTPVADAAGLRLTDATVEPLASGTGLRFRWHVAGMPQQVPPEGVRYTWAFAIAGRVFQLQAKRTNVVSTTTVEDPVGHVRQAADRREFFQLRGACATNYLGTPASGCYHLAFLNGGFDAAAGTISVDLPFETRDGIGRLVAPDFKRGVILLDNGGEGSAGMTIAASLQAVFSNTTVSRYINGIRPYFVGPMVHLGVGTATANPATVSYATRAALAPDGAFSGVVEGLTPEARTVYARACNGTECAYASHTLP